MPFTPYHFGPSLCIALPLDRYIDVPTFVLANVVVDMEPLAVMVLGLNYPLHGYCHTFLIGSLAGVLWAVIAYWSRSITREIMRLVKLSSTAAFGKLLVSAILGVWFHIVLDSFLYSDIRPFYPFETNPLYGMISSSALYLICSISFVPALIIYGAKVLPLKRS